MSKERSNWLYQFVCFLYRIIFYVFFGGRILGEKVRIEQGGFVVMSNHINLLDCVTMAIAVKGRDLHFMAKAELFENRVIGGILRYLHAFPVHRGQSDMAAMRVSMQVLRDGEPLGIFPEGTRGVPGQMHPIQAGTAVLALRSQVPVIPMFISGRYRLWGRLRIVVGRPIAVDDLRAQGADKDATQVFLGRIDQAFAALAVRAKGAR